MNGARPCIHRAVVPTPTFQSRRAPFVGRCGSEIVEAVPRMKKQSQQRSAATAEATVSRGKRRAGHDQLPARWAAAQPAERARTLALAPNHVPRPRLVSLLEGASAT